MELIKDCIEKINKNTVCYNHMEYLLKNNKYVYVVEAIVSDILMKRVTVVDGVLQVNLNDQARYCILLWREWAQNVSIYNTEDIVVYRGVYNMDHTTTKVVQPIPFSTCVSEDFAREWVQYSNNGYVMKINVKKYTRYTFLGNYEEGNEVILPSGTLILKNIVSDKLVEYDFYEEI